MRDQDNVLVLPDPCAPVPLKSAGAIEGADSLMNGVAIPSHFPYLRVDVNTTPDDGLLFLNNWGGSPYLMILGNQGSPRYYRKMPYPARDFKVQPTGLLTYTIPQLATFYAMDSTYAIVDTFRCKHGYGTDEHELQMLPNGHVLMIALDWQIMDMSLIVTGGKTSATVVGNHIQELAGKKKEEKRPDEPDAKKGDRKKSPEQEQYEKRMEAEKKKAQQEADDAGERGKEFADQKARAAFEEGRAKGRDKVEKLKAAAEELRKNPSDPEARKKFADACEEVQKDKHAMHELNDTDPNKPNKVREGFNEHWKGQYEKVDTQAKQRIADQLNQNLKPGEKPYTAVDIEVGRHNPTPERKKEWHGATLGWWYHSAKDTWDKMDSENLVSDARMYLAYTLHLADNPLLPFEYVFSADEIIGRLQEVQELAGESFDLARESKWARAYRQRAVKLGQLTDKLTREKPAKKMKTILKVNECLMQVSRILTRGQHGEGEVRAGHLWPFGLEQTDPSPGGGEGLYGLARGQR